MGIFDWFKKDSSNVPFKDAWEGYFYSDYDNKSINIEININYRSATKIY